MKVISTIKELQSTLKNLHQSPVGFVPTMGALHKGHLSLVNAATSQCPLVVVSIYVNPTQFNNKEDLRKYPRPLKKDLSLLGKVLRNNDIVFTPDDKEMYPAEDKRIFRFGNLDNIMEALHRPGHFNGVTQIVSRFFEIIRPDLAFFGQKDFQQVAVIKELVRQNRYKVKIAVNPIIREPDGLAMSSRNALLEPSVRKNAPVIHKAIYTASVMLEGKDIPEIRDYVRKTIEKKAGFSVEYFEIVDDKKLVPVSSKKQMKKGNSYYGCIAVRAGKIRLIDNIEFQLV
ncbi:MAG: pantoate--beta-alanine ligase [Bacteroidia bacterium]|nr:pantoate--beta-alanine ligase [Bacteroidia bacterium]